MLSGNGNIDISNRLKGIFDSRFGICFNDMGEETLDEELLGWKLRLKARDMLYVFFDIEREFGIVLPEEDIAAGRFNTFNNIADTIGRQLLKKIS